MSEVVRSILEIIRALPPDDRSELMTEVERLARSEPPSTLRDIRPASLGRVLRTISPEDDSLAEMR